MISLSKICCLIPVYNNQATVADIARRCRAVLPQVVVVDDGSTDTDIASLLADLDVVVLRHEQNQGKGRAIMTGLQYAAQRQATWLITIDADGQHYPEDIEKFIPRLTTEASSLVVGSRDFSGDNIPGGSRFGRKFAEFWLRIETSHTLDDCQSGFRAYPVAAISQLKLSGKHYDFEAEILARASWAGLTFETVPIQVWYPDHGEERVTNFKPWRDNFRISLAHTRLVGRRLMPLPHKKVIKTKTAREKIKDLKQLLNPVNFLAALLRENTTPLGLAAAAFLGVLVGTLPIFGLHSVLILYMATRLHLNKLMAFSSQNICVPPLVPAICIELGFYLRQGRFLTDISVETIFIQFKDRLWEWLIGSLIIAPFLAALVGLIVYAIARFALKNRLILKKETAHGQDN